MWCFKNKKSSWLAVLLVVSSISFGQEFAVQDEVFRSFLCENYPLVLNESCTAIDSSKGAQFYGNEIFRVTLSNSGVQSADEIVHLHKVWEIYLNQNELTSFPSDLSNLRNVMRLNVAYNQLTELPDILSSHPLYGDTAVKLVYFHYNQIAEFPDSWFEDNPYTNVVDLEGNLFESLPNFTNYPELRRINVRHNKLTFLDLIQFKSHPRWGDSHFELFPQQNYVEMEDVFFEVGDTIAFDAKISSEINEYFLLDQDSQVVMSSASGSFQWPNLAIADSGRYWIKATNSAFGSDTAFLSSNLFRLNLSQMGEGAEVEEDLWAFSPDGDGIGDYLSLEGEGRVRVFNKGGIEIFSAELPVRWEGEGKDGHILAPGMYLMEMPGESLRRVVIMY